MMWCRSTTSSRPRSSTVRAPALPTPGRSCPRPPVGLIDEPAFVTLDEPAPEPTASLPPPPTRPPVPPAAARTLPVPVKAPPPPTGPKIAASTSGDEEPSQDPTDREPTDDVFARIKREVAPVAAELATGQAVVKATSLAGEAITESETQLPDGRVVSPGLGRRRVQRQAPQWRPDRMGDIAAVVASERRAEPDDAPVFVRAPSAVDLTARRPESGAPAHSGLSAATRIRVAATQRSPEEVRQMLSRYRTGLDKGRSPLQEDRSAFPEGRPEHDEPDEHTTDGDR